MEAPVTNLSQLLEKASSISVPNYQRAYSWSVKNVEVLINDLNELATDTGEQKKRQYYLGHFQFEVGKIDSLSASLLVLDGQQRLTTVFLMYLAYRSLGGKKYSSLFLKDNTEIKFETVSYDRDYFKHMDSGKSNDWKTQSQARLIEAYNLLKQLSQNTIERYLSYLLESIITVDTVKSKYEAVHRFALQNDRGVRATELDVIKADLMLYVYKNEHNSQEAEKTTEKIQECFSHIYEYIEQINLINSELQMLKYAAFALLEISINDDVVEALRNKVKSEFGISSALLISEKLELGFKRILKIQELSKVKECMIGDALCIKYDTAIPFLILTIEELIHDNPSDYSKINTILKHFVYIYYRTNAYGGNLRKDKLIEETKTFLINSNKVEAFEALNKNLQMYAQNSYTGWQGSFTSNLWAKYILDNVNSLDHYNYGPFKKNATYILWKYETNKSYYDVFANKSQSEIPTIDHRLPQNPEVEYPESIYQSLNTLGNLSLLTRSENSSKSNNLSAESIAEKIKENQERDKKIKAFIKEIMFYEGELEHIKKELNLE